MVEVSMVFIIGLMWVCFVSLLAIVGVVITILLPVICKLLDRWFEGVSDYEN